MTWLFPLHNWAYEVPMAPHPGGFGTVRTHHVHEGVDLYAPVGTPVYAVEDGEVVAIETFTGPYAAPPSPWWRETEAVLVQGKSGVVVYGEIRADQRWRNYWRAETHVQRGEFLGHILRVLQHDKGRPLSMLHLELYTPGTQMTRPWDFPANPEDGPWADRPRELMDPTAHLRAAERVFTLKGE